MSVLTSTLKNLTNKKSNIGCEIGRESQLRMSIQDFDKIKLNMSECKFVDASKIIWQLRIIKSVDEIKNLGLFQEIKKTIVLIEWPQIINEIPKNLIELVFEYKNDHQKRSVQVKGLNL